ncbi:MAG: ChbG/HpnK family deacetylase [Candidatus Korobacteraceae bacterium]
MRRLIVNADDLGMTAGINRAIVEGCDRGIITSATLMATAGAFDDAVERARNLSRSDPRVSIGCHIVLLDGIPVLPPEQVTSLVEQPPHSGNAELRISLNGFARSALTGRLRPDEIAAEATAQIERIQNAGIVPSHFDCHKHAHMFPAVLKPLLRTARERGIPAVRNPFGARFQMPFNRMIRSPNLWRRAAELSVLRSFGATFQREVETHGLRTTDGSVGVAITGTLDLDCFVSLVESLPEGTWEFVCHPGYNDADLDRVRTRLRQSREEELEILTSPEARAALQRRGIDLISYHNL